MARLLICFLLVILLATAELGFADNGSENGSSNKGSNEGENDTSPTPSPENSPSPPRPVTSPPPNKGEDDNHHSPPPPNEGENDNSPPPPPPENSPSPSPPATSPPPPQNNPSPHPPENSPSPPQSSSPPPPPKNNPSPPPPQNTSSSPPPPKNTPPPKNSISPPPPPPPSPTSSQNNSSPTPSPPTSPTPSPSSPSSSPKTAECRNKNYTACYAQKHQCPSDCPEYCEVDCVTCKPLCNCNQPGAVCQDPRFIGGDGLTFYFHGQKDRDFCIVSDSNLHIKAHFIGRRNANMKRDFTWVQSLGILFDNHRLFVGAKKTATWDASIDRLSLTFDGEPLYLPEEEGSQWQAETSRSVTVTRSRDTNSVVIEVENNFIIKATVVPIMEKDSRIHRYGITQENCFAHLDLSFKFYSLGSEVKGVLGQTYARNYVSRVKMGVLMPVLGGEREFATSSIFSTDCAIARFMGRLPSDQNTLEHMEYGNLDCTSGLNGAGVVCKR